MKVKMQYTVDIDEVPHEISRLMDKATSGAESAAVELAGASAEFSERLEPQKFYDLVKSARDKMMYADLLLSDCLAIMASYNVAKANTLIDTVMSEEQSGTAMPSEHEGEDSESEQVVGE